MELKEQIKGELLKQKEEKKQKSIEENSKLQKITLYTKPNNTLCENYKKVYTENGIKFEEKNINEHKNVISIIQSPQVPVIFINDNYLIQGRDFQSPQQSIGAIRHYADPKYVIPSFEEKTIELLKNINFGLNRNFQALSRQLSPINKLMVELSKEENEEKNKKNSKS